MKSLTNDYTSILGFKLFKSFLKHEKINFDNFRMVSLSVDFIMSTDKVGSFMFVSVVVRSLFRLFIKFTRMSL
jgi:hypothetical protein